MAAVFFTDDLRREEAALLSGHAASANSLKQSAEPRDYALKLLEETMSRSDARPSMVSEHQFLRDTAAEMIRISRSSLDIRVARELRELADVLKKRAAAIGSD